MKQIISLKTVIFKAFTATVIALACTLFVSSPLYAQNDLGDLDLEIDQVRFLTGVVRDARTNEPIVAAQLSTLNYESAATSDAEGKFSIGITEDTEVILVKAFNYNDREVAVRGKNEIEIVLYSDQFSKFYLEKENLTGMERASHTTNAVSSMDEFYPPNFATVDEMIQSNMGGEARSIGRSGLTGIGNSMFIRGLNSVNANAQPLFVVDGVIWNNQYNVESLHAGYFGNTLMNIAVSDIESVSVIKDGTSIYGSKGSNGVVVIKTKRGASMATKIELNSMYGYIERPDALPMMNVNQSRNYVSDLVTSMSQSEMRSRFGLKSSEGMDDLPFLDLDPNRTTYLDYQNNTDWADEVYQEGMFHSNNISVNGGDDRALYHFTIGYTGNEGVVKTTDMDRLHSRFNADITLTNDLDLGLNVGFTNTNRTLLDDGAIFHTSPTYASLIKYPFLSPYLYTNSGTLTTDLGDSDIFGVTNPTALLTFALNTYRQYRFNMAAKPTWRINDKLTFTSIFDYSYDKATETFYRPIKGVADVDLGNLGMSENMFRNQQIRNVSLYSDSHLSHRYKSGLNRVNSMLGFRYLARNYESSFGEGHNSGTDQIRDLIPQMIGKKTVGINDQINYLSTYAKVDYSYDNRYFVGASVAVDGSSVFGAKTKEGFSLGDHSFGVFPSAEAAWLISSENFMKGASFVDQLKLRASFGLTGNDDIDPYASRTYFSSVRYADRLNGIVFGNIGNKELQWETTSKASAGLETILFNDRWALNADFYRSYTSNLLMLKDLPELAGTGMYWANDGEMSNMGVEVSTNIKVLNLSSLKWEAGASLGQYQNKIEALPGGKMITSLYGADILTSVGSAAGVFYGYKTKGVFATEAEATAADLKMIDANGVEHQFQAGDMHFEDVDGGGYIDEKDRQIIGDPNPDFYGSFFTNFDIKNFSVNALFTFSYGNDVYNYQRAMLESGSDFINQSTAMTNRWFYEGQETSIPKATYGDPMGNARFSDRWIEDGSYLRFKTLTLNYKVPIKSNVLAGLNVWVSANNLITWSNYLGSDPEASISNSVLYQGIDTGVLPYTRSYYVGVKINL